MEGTLKPRTAAALLGVSQERLRQYEATGRLRAIRTPGNHRRYIEGDVMRLLAWRQARRVHGITTTRSIPA
jgi:excisionase family DNA binding protein